jgi:hypothetical protein
MKTLIPAALLLLTLAGSALAAEPARKAALTVTVPTAAWKLKIARIYRVGKTPWVVARLTPPSGFAAEVISEVHAEAPIDAVDGEPRYIVLGKDWSWKNEEPYEFVAAADSDAFLKKLEKRKDAKLLWSESAPPHAR